MTGLKIYLIGIGTGNKHMLTEQAVQAMNECEVFIGAKRMLGLVDDMRQPVYDAYKTEEICGYIDAHSEIKTVGILLSGDCGFYSGAKRLVKALEGHETEIIPGISSLVYLCAKLKIAWDDMMITSLHGQKKNIVGYVRDSKKVFTLLSGEKDLRELCQKLIYYGFSDVRMHIGQNLSYENEMIIHTTPAELEDYSYGRLAAVVIENDNPVKYVGRALKDEEFIRSNVPMTKEEVRTVSLSKLGLKNDSVLYDIGAGTGSVSIAAALQSPDIRVYAIERNSAAAELIEENKRKFAADNIEIIRGSAPEAMKGLEAPSHIFIGGSGGNMEDIINAAWALELRAKIVINTVSLESLAQVTGILNKLEDISSDVTLMCVSKSRAIGKYNLMTAQNPVYIISLERKEKDEK